MPDLHHKYSPSSAHRWLNCHLSVLLEATLPEPPASPYADEGTKAHECAANTIITMATGGEVEPLTLEYDIYSYAKYVCDIISSCNTPLWGIEERVDLSAYTGGFGTVDAWVFDADNATMHVIDLKYGQGVKVFAYDNPQLKTYALGLIDGFLVEKIVIHICQPRIDNGFSSAEISIEELEVFGDTVQTHVAEIEEGDSWGDVGDHCRWCRAKTCCPKQLSMLPDVVGGLATAVKLNNDDLGRLLDMENIINSLFVDLKAEAFDRISKGDKVPGYKMGYGRTMRKVVDEDALVHQLLEKGYEFTDIYTSKLKTLAELDKLAKSSKIELAGVVKQVGEPRVVQDKDNSSDPAALLAEFDDA